MSEVLVVAKAYAYVTRPTSESSLLLFEHPHPDKGIQVPKGGIEDGEDPREAVVRELREETGIDAHREVSFLAEDTWEHPEKQKRYRRHFFRVTVEDSRDEWVHTVTGSGSDAGDDYRCFFADPTEVRVDADMDDYLDRL
ncbi:NUDIX domain-containing protein [Haloarculaceae archaeon H-GB2-1]|nr:NUDIX domain-containing protein [Haloarculaceae archaeon H-GB1-1]MEA5386316.1 NUDIX domain-containing protein [Haloarculaceae archaeon H-GB11]MEA5407818.1 NUDIX domain-containing protein [Haloarculaceae archaeon H-GB2-1]